MLMDLLAAPLVDRAITKPKISPDPSTVLDEDQGITKLCGLSHRGRLVVHYLQIVQDATWRQHLPPMAEQWEIPVGVV